MGCSICQVAAATIIHEGHGYCDACYETLELVEDLVEDDALVSITFTFDDLGKVHRFDIYKEINEERKRQDEQWGGPEHDDNHNPMMWFHYIRDQWLKGSTEVRDSDWGMDVIRLIIRARLVKTAALAVAGIESIDRKEKEKGNASK